jgi:hypothetical protein
MLPGETVERVASSQGRGADSALERNHDARRLPWLDHFQRMDTVFSTQV